MIVRPSTRELAALPTDAVRDLLAGSPLVALLVPVGSVEPHGPHLPLGTDTRISEGVAHRAAAVLTDRGVPALVAPAVPYGVTDYARGFAGAVSLPAALVTSFLRGLVEAQLAAGFGHVCLINNHLEPAQDDAVRAAIAGLPERSTSVACPLTRRWARTLSAEFKSGACHAGAYESSLLLALAPETVDDAARRALPDLAVSLTREPGAPTRTFAELGMTRAYTGSPRSATREDGEELVARLVEMVVTEVLEHLEATAV